MGPKKHRLFIVLGGKMGDESFNGKTTISQERDLKIHIYAFVYYISLTKLLTRSTYSTHTIINLNEYTEI